MKTEPNDLTQQAEELIETAKRLFNADRQDRLDDRPFEECQNDFSNYLKGYYAGRSFASQVLAKRDAEVADKINALCKQRYDSNPLPRGGCDYCDLAQDIRGTEPPQPSEPVCVCGHAQRFHSADDQGNWCAY